MELRSQMHPLQVKATLGIDMVFQTYLVLSCVIISRHTKTFDPLFCSVSDLLDYISPDQDSKGGDAQRKRRPKVIR